MMDRYNRAIAAAHAASTDEEAIRLAELSALVEASLGEPLDAATFAALAKIQAELDDNRERLVAEFAAGKLTRKVYLSRFNSILKIAMERSRSLLGTERFLKIFGGVGLQPEGLVDPNIFFDKTSRSH